MKHLKLIINSTIFIISFVLLLVMLNIIISEGRAQNHADLMVQYPKVELSDTINLQPMGVLSVVAKDEYVIIEDSGKVLNKFFNRLMEMKKNMGDSVVNILHIGDSHIQAGYLTGRTMRLLQKDFGNAGRGWIAPLRIAKTNEPNDYFLRSSTKDWSYSRLGRKNKDVDLGLGCVAIKSTRSKFNFDIISTPNNGEGYSFNRIDVFRHQEALPLITSVENAQFKQGARHEGHNIVCDTLLLPSLKDTVQIGSITQDSIFKNKKNNVYYGMVLRNGQSGILYHSVASNGAMFINYSDSSFIENMTLLNPDLIIVSLGTNETFGRRFHKKEFKGQVRKMVNLLIQSFPDTPIVLTTPPETFKRTRRRNKRIYNINKNSFEAASAIKEVAKEKNMACFDLFSASGGKGAAKKWYERHWLSRDRIHFTIDGYEHQGFMLYRSLLKSWNEYVKEQYQMQSKEKEKEKQIIQPIKQEINQDGII